MGAMKQPVTLALADDVRAGLDQFAAAQQCSRSWVADRAIRDWLAAAAAAAASAVSPTPNPTDSGAPAP